MLEMDEKQNYKKLIGSYTEIMPGRPTIAEPRSPEQDLKTPINSNTADPLTKLAVSIITGAEQQTMNYYMNIAQFYPYQRGRELYADIAMVEEDHVSQYGSLIDPCTSWFENCLMHEYIECYLYYSMFCDESDKNIKAIWERLLEQEIAHLHAAKENLQKYENKDWQEVIPNGDFPELIKLQENVDYVRKILKTTVENTGDRESYINVNDLENNSNFFKYNNAVNKKIEKTVVGGYKKVEDTVVGGYKKVEDKFVDKFLRKDGETIEEAKERVKKEQEELKKKNEEIIKNGGK
jgi:rubrerythrin